MQFYKAVEKKNAVVDKKTLGWKAWIFVIIDFLKFFLLDSQTYDSRLN